MKIKDEKILEIKIGLFPRREQLLELYTDAGLDRVYQ